MSKCIFVFIFSLVSFFSNSQQTENVVIAVIDGARYSETFGDPTHKNIPHIWNELRPFATIYTSFYNNGFTSTCAGHSSIVTGTWDKILNDGSEKPHYPTCFEYYRKYKNTTQPENFIILGKNKLNILSHSDFAGFDSTYSAGIQYSTLQFSDTQAFNSFKEVVDNFHPKLLLVNFPEVDFNGHTGVYDDYIKSISQIDSIIVELWNYIQSDSVLSNKTTLILTNDHGRHTNDFAGHGDTCEGCRHIMLLMIGPDTQKGITDTKRYEQIDILPTVGKLLNFPTPFASGTIIKSSVENYQSAFDTAYITITDTIFKTIFDTIHISVSDTLIIDKDINCGLNNNNGNCVFKIYSNNTEGKLNIEVSEILSNGVFNVDLYDITGKLLVSLPLTEKINKIDIQLYPCSTYFLLIKNAEKIIATRKIIIQ